MTDGDSEAIRRLSLVRGRTPGPFGHSEETSRLQDVGRRHRRKGAPSPETVQLLTRYRDAMRAELGSVLDELAGAESDQTTLDGKAEKVRPKLDTRIRLWDLGIKLGRELGTEIDPDPSGTSTGATAERPGPRRGKGRVDYGSR